MASVDDADHRGDHSLEGELPADEDRRIAGVFRLQADAAALAEEALHRHLALTGRLVLDPGDDDRPVRRRVAAWPDDDQVAIQDAGIDHAVAVDGEGVRSVVTGQLLALKKAGAEVTAQDYRVLYNDGGQWKPAFSEQGNWRRFRRHHFDDVTTDKIRLEILKARNGDEARVYEVRAYEE